MSGRRPEGTRAGAPSAVDALAAAVEPHLRGWVHAGAAPVVAVAGGVLVLLTPAGSARVATAVFAVTAVLLFATSAIYHRGRWSARTALLLKRLDHANIFLIIAGTYTPLAVLLLHARSARLLLTCVWIGALAGVAFRVLWPGASRWLYVPLYLALGWVAVAFLPQFWQRGGPAVALLVMVGGAFYTAGAVIYALRRPNPSPRWFGFHEVFHVLTVVAFAAHYTSVLLAASGSPAGA